MTWPSPVVHGLSNVSISTVAVTAALLLVVYIAGSAVYNIALHPLAGFPGPARGALSRIPFWIACVRGKQHVWIAQLHSQYGPVVRYSPNDLSYVDEGGSAWKAIHGHEKGGREFAKAKEWFVAPANGIYGINSAISHEEHRRFRHVFAPAFSERALKSQEPLFRRHIDMLLTKLTEVAASTTTSTTSPSPSHSSSVVNMVDLFQFTTFDIMGDLTFGQPLGLLESNRYSRWVASVFDSVRVIPVAQLIQYYPLLDGLFRLVEPKSIKDMKYEHFKHSVDRVDRRLAGSSDKPDIWNLVLAAKGNQQLSVEEMYCHADVFMLAGSETTATAMSGYTYFILSSPDKLALLTQELRSRFASEAEITMESTASLKYLNACIQESLRLYPPVPVGVPRVVPSPGRTLQGRFVAPGTRVSVHHYSTYRSPANFADPDTFAPERWLLSTSSSSSPSSPSHASFASSHATTSTLAASSSAASADNNKAQAQTAASRFSADRREALQPFAYGPRNCLGQNMAMHEMRLFLACVFWRFDLELVRDDTKDGKWTDQRAFVLWEKKPLACRVRTAGAAGTKHTRM